MPNKASFSASTTNAKVIGEVTDSLIGMPGEPPTGLRAIGPRITPNFIGDEWSSDNTYLYYDVVLVNGTSYIAKKPVPKGIDITNTDYWIEWASPNAQMADLKNTVESFDSRIKGNTDAINAINSKKNVCVLIGNSFTIGYYTHNYGIGDAFSEMGLFDSVKIYGKDSSSFDNYTLGGVTIDNTNNFNSMVGEAGKDPSFSNDDVSTLIFISAMGDTRALAYEYNAENHTLPDSFDNLKYTVSNAKSTFPNARIYIYFAEWQSYRNTSTAYSDLIPYMQLRVHYIFKYQMDAIYLGWGAFFGNLNVAYNNYREADGYHPTDKGSKILAQQLANALFGKASRTGYFKTDGSVFGASTGELLYMNLTYPEDHAVFTIPVPTDTYHESTGADNASLLAALSSPAKNGNFNAKTWYICDKPIADGSTMTSYPLVLFCDNFYNWHFTQDTCNALYTRTVFNPDDGNTYIAFLTRSEQIPVPSSPATVNVNYDSSLFGVLL